MAASSDLNQIRERDCDFIAFLFVFSYSISGYKQLFIFFSNFKEIFRYEEITFSGTSWKFHKNRNYHVEDKRQ